MPKKSSRADKDPGAPGLVVQKSHGSGKASKGNGARTCPYGHTMHSDVNGGLGVMARGLTALGIEEELPKQIKVLSFLPTPSRVKPIKP